MELPAVPNKSLEATPLTVLRPVKGFARCADRGLAQSLEGRETFDGSIAMSSGTNRSCFRYLQRAKLAYDVIETVRELPGQV